MSTIRLQGPEELEKGIYYEYNPDSKPLGEGAMGRVYKGICVDSNTGAIFPVGIKAIFENIPETVIERARREASVRIDNPHLLKMYGFIAVPFISDVNGHKIQITRYFVIMELLSGITLYDLMQGKISSENGEIIPALQDMHQSFIVDKYPTIQTIIIKVLRGLTAFHDAGYIHRDIDPSNIMVTVDGQVKLIDFGICKPINALGKGDRNLTSTGIFMGKVNYAAPELVMGDVKHQDPSTDLYAMGILLFQLCTGHLPFSGDDNEVLLAHMRKPIPLKEINNSALRRIVAKSTEKSQTHRYACAEQMLQALETLNFTHHEKVDLKKVAAVVATIAVIGVIMYFVKQKSKDDTGGDIIETVSVDDRNDTLGRQFKAIQANLWSKNVKDVHDAYLELVQMAENTRYKDAMFEYGLTLSAGNKDFGIPVQRQKLLMIDPDIDVANLWLRRCYEADNSSYRAIFWILNNMIVKKRSNESSVLLAEITDWISKFDEITVGLDDATATKYKAALDNLRKETLNWIR